MINKKPLIRTTLSIFITIYAITVILAIFDSKPLSSFVYGIIETFGLIIGSGGIGFFVILALITFNRKKITDQLYDTKTNGRFSIDKGELFVGKYYRSEDINPETDFPGFILDWLKTKVNEDIYKKVFLILAGILKAYRDINIKDESSIYAFNCNLTKQMLDTGAGLNQDLIMILGFVHNLGKIEINDNLDYQKIAIKSRTILASIDDSWKLPEIHNLLFIISNYPNSASIINLRLSENNLISEKVLPYLELIKLSYNKLGIDLSSNKSSIMRLEDYDNESDGIRKPIVDEDTSVKAETEIAPKSLSNQKIKRSNELSIQKRVSKLKSQEDNPLKSKSKESKTDLGIKLNELKI